MQERNNVANTQTRIVSQKKKINYISVKFKENKEFHKKFKVNLYVNHININNLL
jgi:hypothetical protein